MVNALAALALSLIQPASSGTAVWNLEVGGQERLARVHLPSPEPPEGKRWPAVLVLHGGGGSALQFERVTRFHVAGRREGFVTAYPQGASYGQDRHAWNSGYLLRDQVGQADDVKFLSDLMDRLVKEAHVDRERIFLVGASNGAMMTYRLIQERAGLVAGAATVVGAMFEFAPKPSRPVPLQMIVAEKDVWVPLAGGWSQVRAVRVNQAAPYQPYEASLAQWAEWNGSQDEPIKRAEGIQEITEHPACEGAPTVGIVVQGAEHGWIGGPGRFGQPRISFNCTETILSFFRPLMKS